MSLRCQRQCVFQPIYNSKPMLEHPTSPILLPTATTSSHASMAHSQPDDGQHNNGVIPSSPLSQVPESDIAGVEFPSLERIHLSSSPVKANTDRKKPSRLKRKLASRRAPKKSKWAADTLFIDSKSPLATVDLRVR